MRYTLILVLFLQLGLAQASAQIPPHLALARICASEVGFSARESCAAIHTALLAKARNRGITWERHARAYSPSLFFRRHAQPRRPWLVDLQLSGRRPRGWYRHLAWEGRWRERWFALLAYCLELVQRPHNPCTHPETGEPLEPWDWGIGRRVENNYRRSFPRAVEVSCPCESRRCGVWFRPWPSVDASGNDGHQDSPDNET